MYIVHRVCGRETRARVFEALGAHFIYFHLENRDLRAGDIWRTRRLIIYINNNNCRRARKRDWKRSGTKKKKK